MTCPVPLHRWHADEVTICPSRVPNASLGSSGIAWASSNDAVASVSGGVVTAKLVGSATITASSGSVSSSGVTVTVTAGAPSQLAIKTQPDGAASGVALTAQPIVEIRDAAGNVVNASLLVVTAAMATGGGTISGPTATAAIGGVATFSGLTITGLIGARTLTFTATGVTAATSAAFTLVGGVATQLAIRTQPVAGTAYAVFSTPAVVELRDGAGNPASSTASITAVIATGGGTLGGTATVAAVAGVATFSSLTVNGTAGARTLTFSSGTFAPVTSGSFNVATAPPAVIGLATVTTMITSVGVAPAVSTLAITNTGVFPLTNLRSLSITYNPVSPTGWLAVTFPSGTDAPATIRLTAASTTLAVGGYTASVVVAGDGATANVTLVVTLTVNPTSVNTYGTTANKVSIVNVGSTLSPGLVSTVGGVASAPDPTITYTSRSTAIATVDGTGRISALTTGQAWVVATASSAAADSVLVIVPRTTGLILKTDLTKYRYNVGDTITIRVQVDTRGAALGAATLTFTWPVYIGSTGVFGALIFIDVNTTASPMGAVSTVDNTVNVMRINGNSVAGATGVVDLAVVRFRVARSGINSLFVNAIELLGTDLSNLYPTATFTQYPIIVP